MMNNRMRNDIRNLILLFLLSVFITILNFKDILMGSKPGFVHVSLSILYILLWFIYGIVLGFKKQKIMIAAVTIYFSVGALFYYIGLIFSFVGLGAISIFMILGPLYGLSLFIHVGDYYLFAAVCIVLTYGLFVAGYYAGGLISSSKFGSGNRS